MSTAFPGAIDSFTTKVDQVDIVSAAHVNNLQDSILAVESMLSTGASKVTLWIPGFFSEAGTNPIPTYSIQSGFYMKVGGFVFVTVALSLSAVVAGTGNLTVNLPIPVGNYDAAPGGFGIGVTAGFAALQTPTSIYAVPGTSHCLLYARNSADARDAISSSVAVTALSASTVIRFGGFYVA